jgi:hypothetical protein
MTPIFTNTRIEADLPVVEDYWSGVLRRLQTEVDVFNQLVNHLPTRGTENELSFIRLLGGLVPRRYGIGTGLLIDAHDKSSNQTDIVIYDQADEPAILAQTSQVLFPIENVDLLRWFRFLQAVHVVEPAQHRLAVHDGGRSVPRPG